jgi:hypothetical protein
MRVTGTMHLIKKAKFNGVDGACVKNVPRVERPTMVGEKRIESIILLSSLLSWII